MLIVIPYPNGKKYVTDDPDHLAERQEQIEIYPNRLEQDIRSGKYLEKVPGR